MRIAHTAELDPATLAQVRALLDAVFDGAFTDDDWDHTVGGIHALVYESDEVVAHAAVAQRRLLYGGRALRCGYVEGVGVRADQRRRGHGDALMDAIEQVIRGAYDLGALSTTDAGIPLYESRNWQLWRGPTAALTPAGVERTPDDDGSVYVLPVSMALDLDAELMCDWRDGDVW